MEQGRMILLRIAGRTTQGKAYFGKALSNLLEDSMVTVKEQKLKPDTTTKDSINQDTTQNEGNK
jgi:hypothetical protein